MEHTKGPWYIFQQWPDRFSIGAFRRGSLCITVAEAKPREIVTASGDESIGEEEALANTRLIAAAPDLLEALEGLQDILNNHYGDDSDETPLIDKAFDAISKAKGL